MQGAQKKKGNQSDGDLYAHGVLRASDELRDPERLFHHPEEEFHLPAALVEVGDLLSRRVEIVGQKAQGLTGLGPDDDLAHRVLHRVFAVRGLPGGQKADPVAEHGRSGLKRHFARGVERRVRLEARHKPAAERVELRPEAEVVIAEVEHIGRARFDRHLFGGADVIDVGGGHSVIDRPSEVRVVDDMRLGGRRRRSRNAPIPLRPPPIKGRSSQ